MKAIITNESKEQDSLDKVSTTQTYIIKDRRAKVLEFLTVAEYLPEEINTIKQALTNYANMVESLEGLREKYRTKLRASYIVREAVYRKTLIDVIADITKVLEGKKNEDH
jgi:hypothetical protein